MRASAYAAEWLYMSEEWLENVEIRLDENGTVLDIAPRQPETPVKVGCLIPGLVNTHCHLELSHMAGLLPPGLGMPQFVRSIVSLRNDSSRDEQIKAARTAAAAAWQNGTQLIGDIANQPAITRSWSENSLATPRLRTFHEYLGGTSSASDLQTSLYDKPYDLSPTPHAPYSVSDELMQAISNYCFERDLPLSFHLMESQEEIEFCETRSGPFAELFERMNLRLAAEPRHPVGYVTANVPPGTRLLAIHLTEAKENDLRKLDEHFSAWFACACPRSNRWIHDRFPDYSLWRKLGLKICVGTDSLASCPDLNLVDDLVLMQETSPDFTLHELIQIATSNGAAALGLGSHFGNFTLGAKPGLLWASAWKPDAPLTPHTLQRLH